ncbi:MAG: restriction endonuclease subunit S [Thermodesulfobacteriota bacterium]
MERFELPEGWERKKLPEVCLLNPRKNEISTVPDSVEVTFVPMSALDEGFGAIIRPEIRKKGEVYKGYTYFAERDVIFAKITPCMENGKSAIALGLINGIGFGSTEFHVLRPGPLVTSEWLHKFVRRKGFREYAQKHMCGAAGQQRVPADFLREIEIPIPPLAEQKRIVGRIEELTTRVKKTQENSTEREAELDVLLQAIYCRMIEGVEWKPLSKVASLVRRAIKTKLDEEYEEMGIRSFGKGTFKKPILTGKQVGKKRIYRIHEGDLVFNNVFAWEKAIAVAKKEDHGRVGSHRFITYEPHDRKATSEFLCHHFLSEQGIEDIRAASPGSAGRNRTLGLKKLEKISVPVPDYDEQKRFAEIARRRQLVQQESAGIEDDMKSFKAALLSKAFRGEL